LIKSYGVQITLFTSKNARAILLFQIFLFKLQFVENNPGFFILSGNYYPGNLFGEVVFCISGILALFY